MSNAWVIGDVMLDQWIYGVVERISPEAPVPIVRQQRVEFALGGAANVAKQMRAWGCSVSLAGVIGNDAIGIMLRERAHEDGINVAPLALGERATTLKTRVVCDGQQMLRIDREETDPVVHEWSSFIPDPNVIVLSDYAKGVLTQDTLARFCTSANSCPVVVDPKFRDWDRYRGATVLTPNLRELDPMLDPLHHDDIEEVAAGVIERAKLEAILVTLGAEGALLVHRHWTEHIPAFSLGSVVDATGAGDVITAVFATMLGRGIEMNSAARAAVVAAGLSVARHGVVTIREEEMP